MERPVVNIISPQIEEINDIDVNSYEANNLLAKYGYKQQTTHSQPIKQDSNANLTFEDVVRMEQAEIDAQTNKMKEKLNGPRAYTFDQNNVNYSNVGYASEDGIGIQISVVSDISINKNLW